jgi:hypothetical protein
VKLHGAYAASAVVTEADIFAIGDVPLDYILWPLTKIINNIFLYPLNFVLCFRYRVIRFKQTLN